MVTMDTPAFRHPPAYETVDPHSHSRYLGPHRNQHDVPTVIPSSGNASMRFDLGAMPEASMLDRLFPDVGSDRQQRARFTSVIRLAAKGWLPLSPVLTSECAAS